MNNFVNAFLFSSTLIQSIYGVYPNVQSVASLSIRPHLASQDPATSMGCFSDYIEKSNDISETYGQDYKQCLLDAKAGRKATEAEMINKRTAIEESSRDICKRLSTCDSLDTTLGIFICHAEIGSNNTKDIYDISGNASEYGNELQEKYRIIDSRHEHCSKIAERSYVESTSANYRNLQACLDGRIKPSSSTTTTTITTSVNTVKPVSSTTTMKTYAEASNIPVSDESELTDATSLPDSTEFAELSKLLK